jgi:sulfur relay (sulfurtransferase) DsrC/TusE family protein
LCNKFGVDFSQENVEASSKALLEKDPKAYYEWKAEGEYLYRDVQSKREQIKTTRANYEISSFVQENQPLIENSPVVKMLVSDYIQNNGLNMVNPKQELGSLLEAIKLVYAEAMQVGQLTAKSNQLASDKSGISGGVATANTPSYPLNDGTKVFTRDEIKSMDTDTFNKYEKEIEKQYLNGLIR